MGQVNRAHSCRRAVTRAGDRAAGVAASDAYFPFADGFQILADIACAVASGWVGPVRRGDRRPAGSGRIRNESSKYAR